MSGSVIDSVENDQLAAWVADARTGYRPAVLLDIQRQPGANIIETVNRIKTLLPQLTAVLPPSVRFPCSPTARKPSAPRSRTCSSRCS